MYHFSYWLLVATCQMRREMNKSSPKSGLHPFGFVISISFLFGTKCLGILIGGTVHIW